MIAEADPGSGVIADAAAAKAKAAHLLVVDDDARIRQLLQRFLTRSGFWVSVARDAAQARRLLEGLEFDMLILDVMMPGESGIELCRRLSPTGQKFLMLSALGDTMDRVVGLEVGAADYLPKPFDPRELLARVNAVLRRDALVAEAGRVYEFRGWRYDVDGARVHTAAGDEVVLTRGELAVLRSLVERQGRVVPRGALLEATRGDGEAFERAVDLAVSRLRRKLAPHGGDDMLETVRGEGYRFVPRVRRL